MYEYFERAAELGHLDSGFWVALYNMRGHPVPGRNVHVALSYVAYSIFKKKYIVLSFQMYGHDCSIIDCIMYLVFSCMSMIDSKVYLGQDHRLHQLETIGGRLDRLGHISVVSYHNETVSRTVRLW